MDSSQVELYSHCNALAQASCSDCFTILFLCSASNIPLLPSPFSHLWEMRRSSFLFLDLIVLQRREVQEQKEVNEAEGHKRNFMLC